MQLSIPKAHRSAFLKFIQLSPAAMHAFVQAMKKAKPNVSLYQFARQLSTARIGLSHDAAYSIIKFLASLYRHRSDLNAPASKFVDSFITAAKEEVHNFPEIRKTTWNQFKRDLLEILEAEQPLALTSKASELSAEHQRRLCPFNCRILSDARPVFVGDPEKDPSAVLVQHVLKIAYHEEDDSIKEFYVAMDGDDLLFLQSILFRAEEKEKSIRRFIKKSGVSVLGDEDVE